MKILFVSIAIVIADQISKLYVKGISLPFLNISFDGIIPGVKYPLAGDLLKFTLVENPGIAFGIDPGSALKPYVTLLTLFITAGLVIYLYKSREESIIKKMALALLIGGAVGNLIDRFFYGVLYGTSGFLTGNVVDFVNISITNFIFLEQMVGSYVFNIADISVSIGLILMIFSLQTAEQPQLENLAAENQD